MGRQKQDPPTPAVTAPRAARLYRLLTLTAEAARPRRVLIGKLRVDLRGFYRDLELLRGLGVEVASDADRYQLVGPLDTALDKLPFPDPGLSLRDVMTLSRGTSEAHRKLRRRLDAFRGTGGSAAER